MRNHNKVICFHNPDEENGVFSNWYMNTFVYNGIHFTSAEQYMMYRKAMLMGDVVTARKILGTDDVRKVKQLGRMVKPYDDRVWSANRYPIMIEGLYCKFTQSADLYKALISTGNEVLCECAVKDCIWGIGLSITDPNRFYPERWKGQNLLGKALMEVRRRITNSAMVKI